MSVHNIPAKVLRPALAPVYVRERLHRLLDEARSRPLVWITSPPGAGKTTLIADYLGRRKLPVMWYQVDSGDDDVATFFHFMGLANVAAVRSKRGAVPLPRFTPDCLLGLDRFSRRFFDAVYGPLKPPFALVLDNYQDASVSARLHEVIRDGLDQLPQGCNVFVLSRNEPPPVLARLRVNNQMALIDWSSLQLTVDEAQGMARQKRRRGMNDDTVRCLHERTQGWMAGMVLMLEQVGQERVIEPDTIGTPSVLFDYFAGEIFEKSDPGIQEILLKSAFLPRMTANLLTQLTGDPGAIKTLKQLNQKGYFTENHARDEPVYQYHPLMREFLQARARATFSPDLLRDLKLRAAHLLSEVGEFDEAIELLRRIEDWEGMVRIILQAARPTLIQGRSQTLDGWISRLPAEVTERSPWLLYWLGVCRFPFNPPMGREFFERAFSRFKARNDLTGIFMAWCGVVESIVHGYTELTRLDHWIATLDGLMHEYPEFPSVDVEARVSCNMFLALVFRQLHHPRIGDWMERAWSLAQKSSEPTLKLYTLGYSVLYHLWMGDHAQAGATLQQLVRSIEPERVSPIINIGGYVIASIYQLYRTTSQADLTPVNGGLAVASATGVHIWDGTLLAEGAGIALSAGDLALADELLGRMHGKLNESRRMDACLYHYFCAWIALLRGDMPNALMHAEGSLAHAVEAGSVNLEERSHILLAQIFHERGERDAAWRHLGQARRLMQRRGDSLTDFVCSLTEAQLACEEGDDDRALTALKHALPIGRQRGYINFYGWQPRIMTRLLTKALEHDIETKYAQTLVRAHGLAPEEAAFDNERWPWPVRVYTFGRFAIVKDGEPVAFTGKAQHKPLELLKALIALGGREVAEETLVEALWPDTEGDAAHQALHTTLHRLRKLLGAEGAVVMQDRKLSLARSACWVDAWVFERLAGQLDTLLRQAGAPPAALVAELGTKAVGLYRGFFLSQDSDPLWSVLPRERLHDKFRRLIHALGAYWATTGQWQILVDNLQRALDAEPAAEEIYQRLMIGFQRLGRPAEAISIYDRCQKILTATLGVRPSPATEAIRQSLGQDT